MEIQGIFWEIFHILNIQHLFIEKTSNLKSVREKITTRNHADLKVRCILLPTKMQRIYIPWPTHIHTKQKMVDNLVSTVTCYQNTIFRMEDYVLLQASFDALQNQLTYCGKNVYFHQKNINFYVFRFLDTY